MQLRLPDLPDDEAETLLRFNPNHFGPGPRGGQFAPFGEGGVTEAAAKPRQNRERQLLNRDKKFLDKYYDVVNRYAQKYGVDPKLVLALGWESGFGTEGTFKDTGDVFGLTNGDKTRMLRATSPEENVQQLFRLYGNQIRGVGSDANAFLNAMLGRDPDGNRVPHWNVYNTVKKDWPELTQKNGIDQMNFAVPRYLEQRGSRR